MLAKKRLEVSEQKKERAWWLTRLLLELIEDVEYETCM